MVNQRLLIKTIKKYIRTQIQFWSLNKVAIYMTLACLLEISLSLFSHTFIIYNKNHICACWEITDVKDGISSSIMNVNIVITNNYWSCWPCTFFFPGVSPILLFTFDNYLPGSASNYLWLPPTAFAQTRNV